ncbi:MAG: flagellar basal-body rod protein FlgG [Candidatus Muiribacteriota bacterium]
MMRSLYTAATGMDAQDLNISVISNNLSNVNTTGYKKSRAEFQDLLYQSIREAGTPVVQGQNVPTGIQTGHGVRPVATQRIFSQGDFRQTENPLDLIIEGDGFFQITRPDGSIAYTRDGAFKMDANGTLVTSDGFFLEPQIVVPEEAESVSVGIDGSVSVRIGEDTVDIGEITLVDFVNPSGLNSEGRNLYTETVASGAPTGPGVPGFGGLGTIQQGYLEMSNVKVVEEMVQMIVAQRAYETNSKAIQTSDQMLGIASGLKR